MALCLFLKLILEHSPSQADHSWTKNWPISVPLEFTFFMVPFWSLEPSQFMTTLQIFGSVSCFPGGMGGGRVPEPAVNSHANDI
jgi:hypothetical protein